MLRFYQQPAAFKMSVPKNKTAAGSVNAPLHKPHKIQPFRHAALKNSSLTA
jgi:hypothetical protein